MATTMHIPPEVLERVDARARTLKVSRNRFVVDALRRALDDDDQWSPKFLRTIDRFEADDDVRRAVDEMLEAVQARRVSKRRPPL